MQIDILTQNINLKTGLVTLLSQEPNLIATGEMIKVKGITLQMTEQYLLLKISSVLWTMRVLPHLFTIVPLGGAGQLYEPVTDMKMIVEANCYDVVKLLPFLHEVSHLDIEQGQLLGVRMHRWHSRDVAIIASAELAVQSNLLTARIKFSTHGRDSQYNCQKCIDQVELADLLEPLCPELARPKPQMKIGDLMIAAQSHIAPGAWADLINQQCLAVQYDHEYNHYVVDLQGTGSITFDYTSKPEQILCSIKLWPSNVDVLNQLLSLNSFLQLQQLTITQTIENIFLLPGLLMRQWGFLKAEQYHLFALHTHDFSASYDVQEISFKLTGNIDLTAAGSNSLAIHKVYQKMKLFSEQVVQYATAHT